MNGDLAGTSAIVTGASRGIGRAITRALLERGASVCATARNADELDQLRADLGDTRLVTVAGAIEEPEHRDAAVATATSAHGAVTLLINNAAVNHQYGPLIEAEPSRVERTLQTNIVAPLQWIQACWADRLDDGRAVVNVSSVGGLRVGRFTGAYNVSKAALIHLTKQLALELAPSIRINAVAVGLVPTHFSAALVATGETALTERHPMKRLGTPEDIADAVVFLGSAAASWITGHTLVVDGGGTSLGGVSAYIDEHITQPAGSDA